MSVLCEKLLFMDVYGLIYKRGLVGALKYANDIDSVNPLLSAKIDSAVESLIVLSGVRAEKSFVKIAQGSGSGYPPLTGDQPLSDDPQINNSFNSLTETQKSQLPGEVKQLQNQTNAISQQRIAELNQKQQLSNQGEQLSLDQRRKLATSVNENAVEQAFNILSAAGKIPIIAFLNYTGVSIQKVLNISALCTWFFKQRNILKTMPELLLKYENGLITADEIVKELKKLPTNSKAFSFSVKEIQNTFDNLTLKAALPGVKVRTQKQLNSRRLNLMTKTHDAFVQPGQVVAKYEEVLLKNLPAHDTRVTQILKDCQGKTYDEILAILGKVDAEAKLLNSKGAGATKPLKDDLLHSFQIMFIKDLKPDFLDPLTKLSPLKNGKNVLDPLFNTEYYGVLEKILEKNKLTKNLASEMIGKLTKGVGGLLNIGSVLLDLKNLYDEYKKNGITAQLICNGLAALANIASFVPPLWPYATAISLALSFGCMFLGSTGVDTKSELNKPANREAEIDLLYKAFLQVNQSPKAAETPQEKQAAYDLFMRETDNASFDSVATVDQNLLKQIFDSIDNRNIPNIQYAFQKNIQNLNTPFTTFRVYLKELDNVKTLAQDPNAKVQFIIPKSKKTSPEQKDQTAKLPNAGEAALGF
jgi:hypothetical protein